MAEDSGSRRQRLGLKELQVSVLRAKLRVVDILRRLGGVHLIKVVRLRANLLLPAERPHGPKAGSTRRRRRRAKEMSQVALAI